MTEMTALEEKWAIEEAEKAAAAVAQATADAFAVAEARKDHDEQVSNIREHLPQATGWRVIVLPYRGARKTKGGIELADQTLERQQLTTTCAYVLSVGPLAYKDEAKFPTGAWCKEGDWIIFGRYAGARMAIDGGEIRILNDDEILATIKDPEDILHI
jgi:co-chaperonin GroES (HSP10)|uniref:Co-chaperonin GroES n=1 Tax=uncultured virus TaxID=340016 RepID=A0A221S3F1_9VIRU|nr:co-chaperonin GroES [uncultured virus]